MAKDDFELEDLDFEDFDLDIPDFDVEPEKDNRKPSSKLTDGFYSGVKETFTDLNTLERSVKLALPEGYSAALNAKDTVLESVKELYNTAADDLKPVTTAIKNSARKISPKVKEKLPKFIQKKIDELEDEYTPRSEKAMREESQSTEIASVMQDIFRAQMESEQERHNQARSEDLVQKTVESNQRNTLIESTGLIAKGIDRLVGYQDDILSRYQQKSLELQFRHYFVAKDLLDITSVHQGKLEEALAKIVKNSALPEAVKIERSEMAGQMMKQRMIASALDGVAGFTSRYRERFMKNAKNFVGGLTSGLGMAGSMSDGMGEGVDKAQMAGNVLGGIAAEFGTDWISRKIGEKIEKHDKVRRGNAKLMQLFTSIPRKLAAWGRSETKGDGYGSLGIQMLKDLMPQFYLNDKIRDNPTMNSDQPAIWDQLSRRTLVEIIPTYLSHIAHWTKATATGEIDGDMQVYNLQRGGITGRSAVLDDAKRTIMPKRENVTVKGEIDHFIEKLFGEDNKLSKEAKEALRRQVMVDVASGQTFDISRYSKYEGFNNSKGSEKTVDELAQAFRDRFGTDEDGVRTDRRTETEEHLSKSMQLFEQLSSVIPTPDGKIRALVDIIGMDTLRELGLVKRVNREDRIDFDRLFDMILSDEDELNQPFESRFKEKSKDDTKSIKEVLRDRLKDATGKKAKKDKFVETDVTTQALPNQTAAIGRLGGIQQQSLTLTGTQVTLADDSLDPYLGTESPIVAELVKIQELLKAERQKEENDEAKLQTEYLHQILDTMQAGTRYDEQNLQTEYLNEILDALRSTAFGAEGAPGQPQQQRKHTLLGGLNSIRKSKFGKGVGWLSKQPWRMAKAYGRGVLGAYKMAGSSALGVANFALPKAFDAITSTASWAGKKLWERSEDGDVMVLGRKLPALRKVMIEAGEYIDVNTKKVITSVKDITGEVKDKAGNIVLTAEEAAKGLYDTKGKRLITKITGFFGKMIKGGFTPYKWAMDAVIGVKNLAKDQLQRLRDGYLKGENAPRILVRVMEEGGYFDQATGKAIKSFSDIKGTVLDKYGNIVVTAKELKESGGLFSAKGEKIKERIGSAIGFVTDKVAGAIKMGLTAYALPFKAGLGIAKRVVDKFSKGASKFGDKIGISSLKLSGSDAGDLIQLAYVQAAYQSEILKVLKSKGGRGKKGTYDPADVDESWRTIKTGNARNPLGDLASAIRKPKSLSEYIASTQAKIAQALENLKPKKVKGDEDGDGLRDGSLLALRRKKKPEKEKVATGDKKKDDKEGGILAFLKSAFPMLLGGLTSIGNKIMGLGKLFSAAKTGAGLLSTAGDLLGGGKGKGGLLRRGAGLLGKAAGFLGRNALRAASFAAFDAVPALATGVGSLVAGIGSIISAPVLLTTAGVAAAGYVGYKIWDHFFNNPGPLWCVRMSQYGFSPRDKSSLKKVLSLEKMLWEKTSYTPNGGVYVNERGVNVTDMLKMFDVDMKDKSEESIAHMKQWTHWFEKRFMPVYKTHAGATKFYGESLKLEEIDEKLPEEKGMEFIEKIKLSEMTDAFNDPTSPFKDDTLSQTAEDVKKYIDKAVEKYKGKAKKDDKDEVKTESKSNTPITAAGATALTTAAYQAGKNVTVGSATPVAMGVAVLNKPGVFTAMKDLIKGSPLGAIVGEISAASGYNLKELTVGQTVRLKAYGLNKLESAKVNLLIEMEERAFKDIKFDGNKRGIWSGRDEDYFDRYSKRFGVKNDIDREAWMQWFVSRFLPVLVQFATSVRSRANVPLADAEKRIRGQTLKSVLNETISAAGFVDEKSISVWEVGSSPWPDYVLNKDRESAQRHIENIDTRGTNDGDILEKDIKPKKESDVDTSDKKGFFSEKVDAIKTTISNMASDVKDKVADTWDSVKTGFGNFKDKVVSVVTGKPTNSSVNKQALIDQMIQDGIVDPKEQAMFMAQVDHESGGFKQLVENLKYSASNLMKTFSKYYPDRSSAERDAGNPEAIANRVYGGRMGNSQPGDGYRYRGRGFIQLTGKANYIEASKALGIDLVNNPEMAEDPAIAARIATWFWKKSGAGAAAKAGDLQASRKRINGGLNGMADVQGKYNSYLSEALAGGFVPGQKKDGTDTGDKTMVAATAPQPEGGTPAPSAPAAETPAPTGLTTPSATVPAPSGGSTMPVSMDTTPAQTPTQEPAQASVSAPSPVNRAALADKQAQGANQMNERQFAEMTNVLSQQLTVQTAMDAKLAKMIELLSQSGQTQPQAPVPSQRKSPEIDPAMPMPKAPVSVSRQRSA